MPGGEPGGCVAAPDKCRVGMETSGLDCFPNREDRWQRFVFDDHFRGGGATELLGLTNDERYDLSVVKDFLVGEQNFVVTDGSDVVESGNVFGEENGVDTRHGEGGGGVAPQDFGVRMR